MRAVRSVQLQMFKGGGSTPSTRVQVGTSRKAIRKAVRVAQRVGKILPGVYAWVYIVVYYADGRHRRYCQQRPA